MGGGAFDAGVLPWIIEIWGRHSPPILQLLKAIGGLGVIIAPLLDEPFVMGEIDLKNVTRFHNDTSLIEMATERLNYSLERRSKLELPFVVVGSVAILGRMQHSSLQKCQ